MIRYSEIVKLSSHYGVLNDVIEKDYCISWLLIGMSKAMFSGDLIFYGGTALKKVYFPDHRFSDDLDLLSEMKINFDKFLKRFERVYSIIAKMANLSLETDAKTVNISGDRLQFFVKYDALSNSSSGGQIKIDLYRGTEFLERPVERQITLPYSDTLDNPMQFATYSLEAILAEKIGAMTGRNEPRDLYDVWFILKHEGIKIAKVQKYLKKKYGYEFGRSQLLPHVTKETYVKLWRERLENQVSKLPRIDIIRSELIRYVNNFFKPYD